MIKSPQATFLLIRHPMHSLAAKFIGNLSFKYLVTGVYYLLLTLYINSPRRLSQNLSFYSAYNESFISYGLFEINEIYKVRPKSYFRKFLDLLCFFFQLEFELFSQHLIALHICLSAFFFLYLWLSKLFILMREVSGNVKSFLKTKNNNNNLKR